MILAEHGPAHAPQAVRGRHHLRHQQRVRLRLPARQHGLAARGLRAARPQLRDRRRGGLDPDRRGADAADHQRPGRAEPALVHRVRQDRAPAAPRRGRRGRLRGRREEEDRRHPGVRGREGRGLARHRQPLRPGQHAAGQLPEQLHQGQGAVQEGQGLRRDERRDPDRGRVHRPHPARQALQRGHAPGHRGQGGRGDQGREPDPRHHHPAELLPALRQAGRHDRHGHHRGQRVPLDLQARRGPDPDQQADDPRRRGRRHLPDARRPSSRRASRTSPSGTRPGSRSWSAPRAWRSPRSCPRCSSGAASRTRC